MNQRERIAVYCAKYRNSNDTDVLNEVEQVEGGFWVSAKLWVSDYEVTSELHAEEADHADAQRKAAKEEGL